MKRILSLSCMVLLACSKPDASPAPGAEPSSSPVAANVAPAAPESASAAQGTPVQPAPDEAAPSGAHAADGGKHRLRKVRDAGVETAQSAAPVVASASVAVAPAPPSPAPPVKSASMSNEEPYGPASGKAPGFERKQPMTKEDPWK